MKTLVLGASENPGRYAYLAIQSLQRHGHDVLAIGKSKGEVLGIPIHAEPVELNDVDTVTLYLNPMNQQKWYDYILSLNPRRIIYNPGTENPELQRLARERGIENVIGCTLVMLSVGAYDR